MKQSCMVYLCLLKYLLGSHEFHHSFRNVRVIVCWYFSNNSKDGTKITSSTGDTERQFAYWKLKWKKVYFLHSDDSSVQIPIIFLKEFIEEELEIEIKSQN